MHLYAFIFTLIICKMKIYNDNIQPTDITYD